MKTKPDTAAPLIPAPDQRLTLAEAATLLGTSQPTLRRWETEGRIRVWRVGPKRAFVSREDLRALVSVNIPAQEVAE